MATGRVVAAVTATDGVTVPPHWSVNFAVRDADSTARPAVAPGGAILMAPMGTPGFRNVVIGNPQAGVIAVSAPASWHTKPSAAFCARPLWHAQSREARMGTCCTFAVAETPAQ